VGVQRVRRAEGPASLREGAASLREGPASLRESPASLRESRPGTLPWPPTRPLEAAAPRRDGPASRYRELVMDAGAASGVGQAWDRPGEARMQPGWTRGRARWPGRRRRSPYLGWQAGPGSPGAAQRVQAASGAGLSTAVRTEWSDDEGGR
jgi:hypothetical protein